MVASDDGCLWRGSMVVAAVEPPPYVTGREASWNNVGVETGTREEVEQTWWAGASTTAAAGDGGKEEGDRRRVRRSPARGCGRQ
ncbi:Os07g0574450 [Oryza sativa Japonica Group]|uniref:Os07g0574450 protein n=2 Tax=Oryza TaxID=4527 RepID=A0A0P0X8M9_ORYSJ|nr:Os07g0574450 [Oryza sativa Japonica Group]